MIMRRITVFAGIALIVVAQADVPVAGLPGTVYRDNVVVRAKPAPDAATVATLQRSSPVVVDVQDGLWFQMHTADSKAGFVRINEVRLTQTKRAGGGDNMQVLMRGSAGHGNVSETAGVRGLDESSLKAAQFNANALAAMDANRVDASAGDRYARSKHLAATQFPYPAESEGAQKPQQGSQTSQAAQAPPPAAPSRNPFANIGGAFHGLSHVGEAGSALGAALTPQEAQDELALGPQIAGRVLGGTPLWNDPAAQQRVNVIGRWVASQTLRPDYPWTFAVIDMPEYNAFAAPGGYVFMTRGLYEVLQSDDEVAAVLAHEISHVVQRDHYNVVRKQQTTKIFTDIGTEQLVSHVGGHGVGGLASKAVVNYVAKFGASLILTHFDKSVEYRSDEAAEVYLVRAGYNPLAIYAILQKLAGVSTASSRLTTLSKTHPSAADRLDSLDKRDMTAMQAYTSRNYVN
jgi:Zn-dependent protease with chaperone function